MSLNKIGLGIAYAQSFFKPLPGIAREPLSIADKQSIEAIESIRKSLLQNKSMIPIIEYGTGSGFIHKTATTESVSRVCRFMSKPERDCLFLYSLIKTLKPLHSVELGTCLGISATYIGSALVQNGSGRLATFEGSPGRAKIAGDNIRSLGLDKVVKLIEGRFQDTLGVHLQETETIDFAFIDGHHDGDATVGYFEQLLPKFKSGGMMVFDDIFWSVGMSKAWRRIKGSDTVMDCFEFKGMGIVNVPDSESLLQNQDQ